MQVLVEINVEKEVFEHTAVIFEASTPIQLPIKRVQLHDETGAPTDRSTCGSLDDFQVGVVDAIGRSVL